MIFLALCALLRSSLGSSIFNLKGTTFPSVVLKNAGIAQTGIKNVPNYEKNGKVENFKETQKNSVRKHIVDT